MTPAQADHSVCVWRSAITSSSSCTSSALCRALSVVNSAPPDGVHRMPTRVVLADASTRMSRLNSSASFSASQRACCESKSCAASPDRAESDLGLVRRWGSRVYSYNGNDQIEDGEGTVGDYKQPESHLWKSGND